MLNPVQIRENRCTMFTCVLLCNTMVCKGCFGAMHFVKREQLNDGYWPPFVRVRFFRNSKVHLRQIIIMLYRWSHNYSQNIISHEANISSQTMLDWNNFCRNICQHNLRDHPVRIGGWKLFLSSKVLLGWIPWRALGVCWGVEKGLADVNQRKAETLLELIEMYVNECLNDCVLYVFHRSTPTWHSIIMSGVWLANQNVNQLGGSMYEHHVIIHRENFVDPTILRCTPKRWKGYGRRWNGNCDNNFFSHGNCQMNQQQQPKVVVRDKG